VAKRRERQSVMSAISSWDNTELTILHLHYGSLVWDISKNLCFQKI
jgi:hypothetical protein